MYEGRKQDGALYRGQKLRCLQGPGRSCESFREEGAEFFHLGIYASCFQIWFF